MLHNISYQIFHYKISEVNKEINYVKNINKSCHVTHYTVKKPICLLLEKYTEFVTVKSFRFVLIDVVIS